MKYDSGTFRGSSIGRAAHCALDSQYRLWYNHLMTTRCDSNSPPPGDVPAEFQCKQCLGKKKKSHNIFCSMKCRKTYTEIKNTRVCKFCESNYVSRRAESSFCNQSCNASYQAKTSVSSSLDPRVISWINGDLDGSRATSESGVLKTSFRKHLLYHHGARCSECHWAKLNSSTGKVPVEVDHIDGDTSNNHISNLRILCPNCHSLTPTFRTLNKDKNPTKRSEYHKEYMKSRRSRDI